MSRYQGWARYPDRHRVLVGWDEHLGSYWVQVIDQRAWRRNRDIENEIEKYMAGAPEWHRLIDELEDVVMYECGGPAHRLPNMAALLRALKSYGGLEHQTVRLLIHDRQLSRPRGWLSRVSGRWFRNLFKTGRLRDRPAP
jgi:hypothetical protein